MVTRRQLFKLVAGWGVVALVGKTSDFPDSYTARVRALTPEMAEVRNFTIPKKPGFMIRAVKPSKGGKYAVLGTVHIDPAGPVPTPQQMARQLRISMYGLG